MAWKPKFLFKEAKKLFSYFRTCRLEPIPKILWVLIHTNKVLDCPKHNPKVLYLDLKSFFFTLIFSKSLENRSTMTTQMESSGPKVL